jgi:type II secretory pathway pseudopilin PulG
VLICTTRPPKRHGQRGMSIVELMVGIAVGLMVTAAASLLMSGQLVENRRLVIETQMQQDLRAALDIMSRELRRSGSNSEVPVLASIWYPGGPSAGRNDTADELGISGGQINYWYTTPTALAGPFGYKKDGTVLRTFLGENWQELTDPNIMSVTAFTPTITPEPTAAAVVLPCPKLCSDGTTNCWPRHQVRTARLEVEAQAKRDSTVKRAISGTVRLRNDYVLFSNWTANQICPV